MSMLDVKAQSAEADGKLTKMSVSRDGKDEDAYLFETQIAFRIENYTDTSLVSHLIPGAREVLDRAQAPDDNWKFNSTASPDLSGLRVTLSHAQKGIVAIEGACELRSAKLVASKKGVTCTLKLAHGGQTSDKATKLTDLLGCATTVSLEQMQQDLFNRAPTRSGEGPSRPPVVGSLVVAREGEDVFIGRVAEIDDTKAVLEDFDSEYRVDLYAVTSVITLSGDVAALRRSFKDRCKRKDVTPTWEAVLLAVAEDWDSAFSGGGDYELTAKTVQRAVERLSSGAATVDDLPPEPTAHA